MNVLECDVPFRRERTLFGSSLRKFVEIRLVKKLLGKTKLGSDFVLMLNDVISLQG